MTETKGIKPADPSTLEEARDLILHHTARMNAEQHRIGRLFIRMVAKKLTGDHHRSSAKDYLKPEIKELSPANLYTYSRVALRFTRKTCMKYGMRRLNYLLAYAKRFRVIWTQPDPGLTPIEIPGSDGTLRRKPFAECTREEMRQAMTREAPEAALKKAPKEPMPVPRADAECLQLLRDGLVRRLGLSSRTRLTAKVLDKRVHITLKNVSVADLDVLVGALLESLEPLYEDMYRKEEELYRRQARRSQARRAQAVAPLLCCEPAASATALRAP